MNKRVFQISATLALAAGLWIVPSVGTRGQGTLGDRFVHADREIVGDSAAGRNSLKNADAAVVAAVSRL